METPEAPSSSALALWDRALQQNPEYALAHFSQANIYKLKGMAAQAIASFQVVLRFRPDYAAVYMNMAAIYQTMNLPDQSVDVCLAGLKFEPNNGLIHGNLAIGLHQQGAQRRGDCSLSPARSSCSPTTPADTAIYCTRSIFKTRFGPRQPVRRPSRVGPPARRTADRDGPSAHERSDDPTAAASGISFSPYFRQHAVNAFAEPMIAAHDHGQFGNLLLLRRRDAACRRHDVAQSGIGRPVAPA